MTSCDAKVDGGRFPKRTAVKRSFGSREERSKRGEEIGGVGTSYFIDRPNLGAVNGNGRYVPGVDWRGAKKTFLFM